MTVHLPEDLERYIRNEVQSGRFASEDEAIAAAVRLLRQRAGGSAASQKRLTEGEWQRRLVEVGLMSLIPPGRGTNSARPGFQPIQIKGEPLSETIIRERR